MKPHTIGLGVSGLALSAITRFDEPNNFWLFVSGVFCGLALYLAIYDHITK